MSTEAKSLRDLDSATERRDETKSQIDTAIKDSRPSEAEMKMSGGGGVILERMVYGYLSYAWDV